MIYPSLMTSVCLDEKHTSKQPTGSYQDSNPIIGRYCWNEPEDAA